MSILLAALLLVGSSELTYPTIGNPLEPTFNLSAVRQIVCNEGIGSGFMIGDDIVVTANHVTVMTGCKDRQTGAGLLTYKQDVAHDFALMTGKLPDMSYIKYDCSRYKKGELYISYGISDLFQNGSILRAVSMIAEGKNVDIHFEDGGDLNRIPVLSGYNVGGMSGGMIVDPRSGYAIGLVNAGREGIFRIPVGISYSYELADTILCK